MVKVGWSIYFLCKPFEIIKKLAEKLYNYKLSKSCVIKGESRFYYSADVINLQNDPSKIQIGEGTHIRGKLLIYPYGDGLLIGDNSYIGENSIIRAADRIEIGNNVLIAHNVTIIDTDSHEINHITRAESYKSMLQNGHPKDKGEITTAPITIKDYAWISYNVSILKGVTIGKGAIIGAGTVVTHDISDFCIAAGNPAKIIRTLKKNDY